jgi:hypothetical protein
VNTISTMMAEPIPYALPMSLPQPFAANTFVVSRSPR